MSKERYKTKYKIYGGETGFFGSFARIAKSIYKGKRLISSASTDLEKLSQRELARIWRKVR